MIIYGHNSSNLENSKPNSLKCPSCENNGTTSLHLFGKYATLFWIPMFPMGKNVASECDHCKVVLEKKQMPQEFNLHIENLKGKAKTPIWNWVGLTIIVGVINWATLQSQQHDKDVLVYAEAPAVHDLYDVKLDNGSYTTYKVTDIENDSIHFKMNEYEINKSSKLHQIDKDENYSDDVYTMHKSFLIELKKDGTIMDISRD